MTQHTSLVSPNTAAPYLDMVQPDDWHLHLRDGADMASVLPATARHFGRALVMPNLKPPVTTVAQALAYRARILAAAQNYSAHSREDLSGFSPLMTLYLTDTTAPDEIDRAVETGLIPAVKLYPAGATTNSDSGVTDLARCDRVLERMQARGMVFCLHGEVTHSDVDVFDREARFIDEVLIPLRARYPALKIVLEHITTRQAADYVRQAPGPLAATITPQHLLYNRNALFKGGIRPHYYCLPVLKRETHRQALLQAATSGSPRFFLGTDSAPHAQSTKETGCGCAGCYSAPFAMALYAQAFDTAGALDRLEGFASLHGPQFYGVAPNTGRLRLHRQPQTVPERLPFGSAAAGHAGGSGDAPISSQKNWIVPLAAGEAIDWTVTSVA
ncbi:MAG: dihydroorotase [Burkholderiaceae bacterium]